MGRRTHLAVACTAALVAVDVVVIFAARTLTFSNDPTVPLAVVEEYAGDGFNDLAAVVDAKQPSLLTPDLGGALLTSTLRIYDLAGLCDRRVAAALSDNDRSDLWQYVFEEIRPTFIHTHGAFTRAAQLHEDPRFARDYVVIAEHNDGPAEWSRQWSHDQQVPAWAGDYVRRDALGPNNERLSMLRDTYFHNGLDKYRPWVRPRPPKGWFRSPWAIRVLAERIGGQPAVSAASTAK